MLENPAIITGSPGSQRQAPELKSIIPKFQIQDLEEYLAVLNSGRYEAMSIRFEANHTISATLKPGIWGTLILFILLFEINLWNILALLPIGLLLYSISSNFCACIFTWCCSTRTELLQKGSLLVRIRTIVERISICFFEPGDLRFRPDSGQMEEDLVAVQHVQLNQIIFALEDLLEQHAQPDILLILISSLLLPSLQHIRNVIIVSITFIWEIVVSKRCQHNVYFMFRSSFHCHFSNIDYFHLGVHWVFKIIK